MNAGKINIDFVERGILRGNLGFSLQHVNSVSDHGNILYSECLARLVEADGTIRTGGELLASLEAAGSAPAFDRYMLELAFDWLSCNPLIVLGCNISASNLADVNNWAALYDLLAQHRSQASRLVLEITESLPMATLSLASELVQTARALGYRVAIDDFGKAHATAELLLAIPVDIVKIDAFFVGHPRDDSGRFLSHMVALASCAAPTVIVEGIETYAQLETAKAAGAAYVQEFLLSEPSLAPIFCGRADSLAI